MGKLPGNHFQSTRLPSSLIKRRLLLKYIVELKEKGAILEVPSDQKGRGFYSPLFLVKKKTGNLRPVLDLKNLNRNIKIEAFKMESLQSILLAVNLGGWMLSVDLSDAYLHIPVHPPFQKFLRFAINKSHLQFHCLPFGISSATRTFTKVLLPLIAFLREKGLRVHHYLDDILLLAEDRETLLCHRRILLTTLQDFGWLVNWKKSSLQPTQNMVFLGADLNTKLNRVQTPSGEDSASSTEDAEITISEPSSSQNLLECARLHVCNLGHDAVVTMAHESPAKLLSKAVGWSIDASDHYHFQTNEAISVVVDTLDQPQEIQADSSSRPDNSHFGCLSEQLGSSLSRSSSAGPMAVPGPGYSIECTGTQGSFSGPRGICISPQREERAYPDGQQGGSVLHPEARGYQESHTDGGSLSYLGMGTGAPSRLKSNICSCGTEHVSRLPESRDSFKQRMVPESPGLFSSYGDMGNARDRLSNHTCEYEVSEVSVQSIVPFSRRDRLSNSPMQLQVGVQIPANSINREIPVQASEILIHGNRGNPSLTEKTMVHDPIAAQPSTSNPSAGNPGFAISRPISTPGSREVASDGMEVERVRLREQGCSQEVISTLMQARKNTTNNTYTRIWNKFFTMAQQKGWDPIAPEPSQLLEFLQSGINKGLSSSTLKLQVSALSAKTGTRWALHPLVIQFLRACLKIKPPKKPAFPSWDLSVVLDAFTNPPFTPSESISLWDLTLKLSFLIAITSAKRVSEIQALMASEPYLVFFPDKVVLRPSDHFIPKVATSFHYNQDIVLPSFTNDQGEPHPLPFRNTDTLMVIPHGNRRGQAATSRTIASWLVKSIKKVYSMRHLAIPEGIRAHSTRAVSTCWAAYCRVSPETICKAATWSSRHTFISHYRVDSAHLAMADFGRSVVRANSSAL